MTSEERPPDGFTTRMAFAVRKDPDARARRTRVTLQILLVTLAWVMLVPLLVGVGLLGTPRHEGTFAVAAVLTLLGPFTAAVVATRNQRFGAGAAYIVLTLLMIVPALAIAHFA